MEFDHRRDRKDSAGSRAPAARRIAVSAVDPGDSEHVSGARRAKRNTGRDDDPLAGSAKPS